MLTKAEISLLALLAFLPAASAQTKGIKTGAFFSPSAVGVSTTFPAKDNSVSEIVLTADLEGILSGRERTPGVKGEYRKLYILTGFSLPGGLPGTISAGPGLAAGYVMDGKTGYGIMGGVCGAVKLSLYFNRRVVVETGFCADVAFHATYGSRYRSTLKLYRNGLREAYYPELALKYRF